MDILKTTNLKKYYGQGDTQVKALDGVDFVVGEEIGRASCRERV